MSLKIDENAFERRKNASILAAQRQAYNQNKDAQNKQIAPQNKNFFEKVGDTLGDIFVSGLIGEGIIKGVESVVDFGSSIVGGIAGLVGDTATQKKIEENIKYDWTGENILNPLAGTFDASVVNDSAILGTVKNVASGVGQMLPNVAVSFLPGGQAISMGLLFGRASGGATEEALSEGAGFNQALLFGGASGALELLSEGISDKLFGASTIDKAAGVKGMFGKSLFKTAKSGLGRAAQEAVGEGLEEGFSELFNPLLKRIYTSEGAEFLTQDHLQNILDSAVVGALTSLAFKGTVGQIPAIKNSAKLSHMQDQIIEYNDKASKLYEDATTGKLTSEEITAQSNALLAERQTLESELNKIYETLHGEKAQQQAQDLVNSNKLLKGALNGPSANNNIINGQIVNNNQNLQNTSVASPQNYNVKSYSTDLIGKDDTLVFKPTTQELPEDAKKAMQLFVPLSKALGSNIDYVFSDDVKGEKGAYANGVLYLNKDLASQDIFRQVIMHEFTHNLENTDAYRNYVQHIINDLQNNPLLAKQLGINNDFVTELTTLWKQYLQHGAIDSNLSINDQANIAISELVAKYTSEKLFADERAIMRLCQTNLSLGQKILRWIKDTIAKITGKSKEERQLKAFLRKAENLYSRAIEEASKNIKNINVIDTAKTTQSQLDNENETKYSIDNKGEINGEKRTESTERTNLLDRSGSRRGIVSFSDDSGTTRLLSEITGSEETRKKIQAVASEVYSKPKNTLQYNLKWFAKEEHVNLYFMKYLDNVEKEYVFEDNTLFLKEDASEKYMTDILNIEKPIVRNLDPNKVAHISQERWNKFLQWQPNAYVTRMPIQQFLDMTTESYVDQRQINARSKNISTDVNKIKNSSGEYIYLKIDFENNKVDDHEGRHRMTSLLNAGNTFVDVFIIPTNQQNFEAKSNLKIKGQFNNKIFELGLVKANSQKFSSAVNATFLSEDNNIRYSITEDEDANKLLDMFTLNDLLEMEAEISKQDYNEMQKLPTKNERRESFVKKLYENGSLNKLVTKIVENNPSMYEYFKDTRMNRKYDNLFPTKNNQFIVMFHGTPNAYFNEFNSGKIGANGTQMGSGFYFTESLEYAKGYSDKSGRVIATLLNIEKPLSRNKHEITKQQLKRFIGTVVDSKGDDYLSNYGDVYSEGYNNVLDKAVNNLFEHESNDADMIEEIYISSRMDFDEFHDGLTKQLGYDGIIAWNKAEGTQAIVFKSNQIKDIFNYKPTKSNDIRFSISDETDSDGEKLSEGQQQFFKNSKIRIKEENGWKQTINKDGKLFPVYHGTDSDEFFEFDKNMIGSANDMGWYGKGYYFAFSKSEAGTYGRNVLKCYLNIENPFFFTEEMQAFDGIKSGDIIFDFASFVVNLADKFPSLSKTLSTDYATKYNEMGESDISSITFYDLATKIKEVYKSDRLRVIPFQNGNETQYGYIMRSNFENLDIPKELKELIKKDRLYSAWSADYALEKGKINENQHDALYEKVYEKYDKEDLEDEFVGYHRFNSIEEAKENRLSVATDYLHRYVYRDFDMHMPETYMQQIGDDFRKALIKNGYDGVLQSATGDEVVAFYENQIKLTSNKNPTLDDDIRYSIDDDSDLFGDEDSIQSDYIEEEKQNSTNVKSIQNTNKLTQNIKSADEVKYRAKTKQDKVYDKTEIEEIINDTIKSLPDVKVTAKVRDSAIEYLFDKMNSQDVASREDTANTIADFILNNSLYELNEGEYDDYLFSTEQRNAYSKHLKNIKFSQSIYDELKYRYGEKQARGIILALGDGKVHSIGTNIIDIANEINDDLGATVIDTSLPDQDVFLNMYEQYQDLKSKIDNYKNQMKDLAKDVLREDSLLEDKKILVKDILNAYDTKGSQTPLAKLKENYKNSLSKIRKDIREFKAYSRAYLDFMEINGKAKDIIKRKYSASVLDNDIVKAFLKEVAGATNIKNLSPTARERMRALKEIYTTSSEKSLFKEMLGSEQENFEIFGQKDSIYDENLAAMIDYIASGNGPLTKEELLLYTKVTQGFIHLYTTFDKVFKDGRYQETFEVADKYLTQAKENAKIRNKKFAIKFNWKIRNLLDPQSVMRNMDSYGVKYNKELGINEDIGFFTEMYKEITDGEVKSNVKEIELLTPFGEFYKNHKGFEKDLLKKEMVVPTQKVDEDGVNSEGELRFTLGEAISTYLTSLRPQSNFYETTITLKAKDNTLHQYKLNKSDVEILYSKFTEEEKAYIKLVQRFFNEDATALKVETDERLYGYTNIEEGRNYFPINREKGALAKNIGDANTIIDAVNVYTLSFNKTTRPHAKQSLMISNVYQVVQNHAKGISTYYGLTPAIKAYNQIFNKKVGEGGQDSLRRLATSQIPGSNEYINSLLIDIQGRHQDNSFGNKALRKVRSAYATYQLGANLKTVLGQTSSYFMAGTYLDTASLTKGLTMRARTDEMYQYCPFTKYRMEDKAVIKAQGNFSAVSKVADTFTQPIQWMDNNVVKKLWCACQVQVEKNAGYKIGSEDNLKTAGKLLEKVVRETQSNSIMSEKTGLARSQNELLAALTMFTSDAQKQISRLADGIGTFATIQEKIKEGTLNPDSREAKVGKKLILRATASFVTATTSYVLIGILMKTLLNKRDEDKTFMEEFGGDFASQVAGLIPIFKDIYGYLNDGYGMNNYAYSMITDFADAVKSMWEFTEDIISGKQMNKTQIASPLRKAIYATSQLLGIPTRNIYNYTYGIINQFSPETAYAMNSLFYEPKAGDLQEAIENNQDNKARVILKELFSSKNLSIGDKYLDEILRLYKEGYSVIPSTINESFTYNDTKYNLTSSQRNSILAILKGAVEDNGVTIGSIYYKNLSDKAKASYLKTNYNLTYITAISKIVGPGNLKDSDYKKYLFIQAFGNNSKMLEYMAYISSIESDFDKKGNAIANSRKLKIQKFVNALEISAAEKYILMGYAGYKNTNGEAVVKSYLSKKGFTKDDRDLMLSYCGY